MNTQALYEFVRTEAERINEENYSEVTVTDATVLADDLDVDSLAMLELCIRVEERFGVPVADEDASRIVTVGDLRSFLASAGSLTE